MAARRHAAIAAVYLLLSLSPLGAPAVGFWIAQVCPIDSSITRDGPFAMSLHYCGISRSVEDAYQQSAFLPVLVVFAAGQLVGGILAYAWFVTALVLPFAFLWNLARALQEWLLPEG